MDILEKLLAANPPARDKDWRQTVGMFADSEFMRQVDAEIEAMKEAERAAAREGRTE